MCKPCCVSVALVCAFLVIATLNARNANGTTAPNNSGVQATSKCHNMYTYNSFYAGANNKIEALLREVKHELSEIREELRCMKENKTIKTGRSFSFFIINCFFLSTSTAKLRDKGIIVHFYTYFQLS